jgi:aspartate racemase
MKTIGLLGGMSWESTQDYYRGINQRVKARLGGLHSAQLVLFSVDFAPIEEMQHQGDWEGTASVLVEGARRLEAAGAGCVVLCTNTMHKVAPQIEAAVDIPLLHIADATGQALERDGIRRVGLLGTAFTMEQAFYRDRLAQRFGLDVLVPPEPERQTVHSIIYEELCQGRVEEVSRKAYLRIIDSLANRGAQAVILGCTEIGMLVRQSDTPIPLYDTTNLHTDQAVAWYLQSPGD